MTTQIRLSAQGNDFIEDVNGGLFGLEYEKEGDIFRCFCVNFSEFDLANRSAKNNFVIQIKKANGGWKTIDSFHETVSDSTGYIRTDLDQRFGNRELDPFIPYTTEEQTIIDEGGTVERTLKDNVCTEAQFFIDTIVKNKYGVPVDMSTFIYVAISRHEGL